MKERLILVFIKAFSRESYFWFWVLEEDSLTDDVFIFFLTWMQSLTLFLIK